MTVVGVDLGGTNLRVAAVEDGAIVRRQRVVLGEARGVDAVVAAIAELVAEVAGAAAVVPVGVGVAAMLADRRGTVVNAPNLGWRDVGFGAALAARLGARHPLGVYNDVNAIAFGELGAGAGRGARDLLAVFVGTGIGAGVIASGALVEGASNCAGELGHVKVAAGAGAARCGCGAVGCVEAYVGGAALQARIRRELAAGASPAVLAEAGAVDAAHPGHVDALADDDPWARALWDECGAYLALAIGNALTILNSDRLVLGGGVLGRAPRLRARLVAGLPAVAPAAIVRPLTIVDAALGDDAGLIGAALLAGAGVSLI
ncbi:MAG: ROK family protein [Myxococcales bacterium]|nr:ROK family protein [Myxococcales bacterium]MBK7191303.1 ROK family protein [Myxococcales bacterium]